MCQSDVSSLYGHWLPAHPSRGDAWQVSGQRPFDMFRPCCSHSSLLDPLLVVSFYLCRICLVWECVSDDGAEVGNGLFWNNFILWRYRVDAFRTEMAMSYE